MREITEKMIKNFKIMKLGFDFMGYSVDKKSSLSFHHLIIPHRESHKYKIGEGYLYWNGAILRQNTSHDYLHLIETIDYDMFMAITSEMIDENIKGYLDIANLRYINDVLCQFEYEHCSDMSKKGKLLIKDDYLKRRKF